MGQATPKMRDFSERLIAHATRGNKSSKTETSAIFLVVEKLRPNLVTLLGKLGFRALLSRALVLTNSEIAWLRAVHVKADGSLEGLHELEAQLDPEEIAEGTVVLLAQLLGLLVVFIGESLTLRLVRDVWPKLSLDD
jgi:nicotinic acid phosphoribosyltransferase